MVFDSVGDAKNFYRQYKNLEDGEYEPKANGYYQNHAVHNSLEFGQYIIKYQDLY